MAARAGQVIRLRRGDLATEAVRLRVQGATEREIATQLGLSQQYVNKLLKRAEQELFATRREALNRFKVRAHERYELVFREARDGWERSKAKSVKRTVESTRPGPVGKDDPAQPATKVRQAVVEEEQVGDPAFLGTMLQAVEGVNQLWGLKAPVRVQTTREETPWEQLGDEALVEAARRELDAAAQALGVALPPPESLAEEG